MKNKILIFILSFTLLFSIFCISTFASTTDLSGQSFHLTNTFVDKTYDVTTRAVYDVDATLTVISLSTAGVGDYPIDKIYIGYYYNAGSGNYKDNVGYVSFRNANTGKGINMGVGTSNEVVLTINGGKDATNQDLIDLLLGREVVEPEPPDPNARCDGSSCPATDVNYDNVCDDCMLMFAVPRSYNLYDYNGHSLPSFDFDQVITTSTGDLVLSKRYPYAYLFKSGSDFTMVVIDLPLKVDDSNRLVTTQNHTYYYHFKLTEGSTSWEQIGGVQEQYYAGVYNSSYMNVVWTKTDLKNLNNEIIVEGDLNFPQPPLPLKEVVKEAVGKAEILEALLKVLKVLIICGTGLLAFLILFGICHKVLSNFLRT